VRAVSDVELHDNEFGELGDDDVPVLGLEYMEDESAWQIPIHRSRRAGCPISAARAQGLFDIDWVLATRAGWRLGQEDVSPPETINARDAVEPLVGIAVGPQTRPDAKLEGLKREAIERAVAAELAAREASARSISSL
jgi:hypothetical protein